MHTQYKQVTVSTGSGFSILNGQIFPVDEIVGRRTTLKIGFTKTDFWPGETADVFYLAFGYESGKYPWSQNCKFDDEFKAGIIAAFNSRENRNKFVSALHSTEWAANCPNPAKFGGLNIRYA